MGKLFPLEEFIKPDELFVEEYHLLFSNDEKRKRIAHEKLMAACRAACLNPKEVFVRDRGLILLCDGYVPIHFMHDTLLSEPGRGAGHLTLSKIESEISTRYYIPYESSNLENRYYFK